MAMRHLGPGSDYSLLHHTSQEQPLKLRSPNPKLLLGVQTAPLGQVPEFQPLWKSWCVTLILHKLSVSFSTPFPASYTPHSLEIHRISSTSAF